MSKTFNKNIPYAFTGSISMSTSGNLNIPNSITTGSARLTTLNATGSNHTLGNILISGGNVGINMFSPGTNSLNGDLHITSRSTGGETPAILTLQPNSSMFARGQCQIRAVSDATLGAGAGLTFSTRADNGSDFDPSSLISERMRISQGGNVGIGTTSPIYKLDVNGTFGALTVTTGNLSSRTATIGTLLNTTLVNYGINGQFTLNGGGVVTWSGTSLLWSSRVIIIPAKIPEFASNGYINIDCPTSGTITYYNSANVTTTVTCTASGIPMSASGWEALYYEVTPGQTHPVDQTKFRLVNFLNSTWQPTSNWILIAVLNGDNTTLKWIPGNSYIPSGGTFNPYAIFNSGGNIGIGTSSPSTLLTIDTPSLYTGDVIRLRAKQEPTAYNASFTAKSTSGLVTWGFNVRNGNTDYNDVLVLNRGNVGVGTSSPSTNLHIYNSTNSINDMLTIHGGSPAQNNCGARIYIGGNSNHYSAIEGYHSDNGKTWIKLKTTGNVSGGAPNSPQDRVTIDWQGYVGINGTPSNLLDIRGEARSGTHGSGLPLYVSGNIGANFNGVEIRHSNGTQGIGFGYNTIYATGSNTNQDLSIKPLGTGTVYINGPLSKSSGTFDIEHPLIENKRLIHSFIEGPRCDLIYRGKVKLVNGTAIINLDTDCVEDIDCAMTSGTFEALCRNPQYFLQNNTSFNRVRGNIIGNQLTIISENVDSTDEIYWSVIAERKDSHIYTWVRTNSNGYLQTEYVASNNMN